MRLVSVAVIHLFETQHSVLFWSRYAHIVNYYSKIRSSVKRVVQINSRLIEKFCICFYNEMQRTADLI
jgi:hypothetical protein